MSESDVSFLYIGNILPLIGMDESIDFNLDNNDFATYLSHTGIFLIKDYSFPDTEDFLKGKLLGLRTIRCF